MVDVSIINYGKPWTALVTLKSLLNVSGHLIDKIYYVEERNQPSDYDFKIIEDNLNYSKLIRFVPEVFIGLNACDMGKVQSEQNYRDAIRYEYGLQQSDKDYVLIIHNDVVFHKDIIKPFLDNIGTNAGIGRIGQCWNCPIWYDNLCDGTIFYETNVTQPQILQSAKKYPHLRGSLNVNDRDSIPLTECRLNEFIAMLDMNIYRKEVIPNGTVTPLGVMHHDIGTEFFNDMHNKGYRFKNYFNTFLFDEYATHAMFNPRGNGHDAMSSPEKYLVHEKAAKEYYYSRLHQ